MPNASRGFITPPAHCVACSDSHGTTLEATRRNILEQFLPSIVTTTCLLPFSTPLPAVAAEKEAITAQTVKEAFDAVRYELNDPSGVVATLQKLIDSSKYEDILQYTKESDAYFRKGKMGRARKLLTDSALKNDAVLMSNAVRR